MASAFNLLCLATLLACLVVPNGAQDIRQKEREILDNLLRADKYNTDLRPESNNASNPNGPVIVNVNMYLRQIQYIDSDKMEWGTQVTFRQQWYDPRLKFDSMQGKLSFINLERADRVWRPDVFFANELSGQLHVMTKPNELIRIYPDGNVLYSMRITLKLSCPMDLKYFPRDKQLCPIRIASYGHTTDEIVFLWKDKDPIQVTKQLNLPDFYLEKFMTDYCNSRTNTGEYSCLKVDFQFAREPLQYNKKWFCPTAVLTFVSFISFWLNPKKIARLVLLVITLLLLMHKVEQIQKESPRISYSTAIDCWTGTCTILMVLAFVELGVVRMVDKLCKRKRGEKKDEEVAMKPLVDDKENHVEDGEKGEKEYTVNASERKANIVTKFKQTSLARKIDIIAGVLFPIIFIVFIIAFAMGHRSQYGMDENGTLYATVNRNV